MKTSLAKAASSEESPFPNAHRSVRLARCTRVRMCAVRGAEIGPGEDVEYCEVGRLPGDADKKYFVSSFELGNQKGSHHLIVSAAVADSPAEAKLEELGVGNRVPCLGAESKFGPDGFVAVGGTPPARSTST